MNNSDVSEDENDEMYMKIDYIGDKWPVYKKKGLKLFNVACLLYYLYEPELNRKGFNG